MNSTIVNGICGGKINIKTKCLTNQNSVSQILINSFGTGTQ